uniref:Si:dkey-146m20.13 n=1 Tax=Astyanax mexicanus TaxID=7994 RepID=A0A3B1KBB2_ASTMX
YYIDSFGMTKLWQGSYQILRKCNPSQYEVILGVINEHNHWTLAVIYPQQKKNSVFGSLGGVKNQGDQVPGNHKV